MRRRRETVEHPFGTIKARIGATHFLTKTFGNPPYSRVLTRPRPKTADFRGAAISSVIGVFADVAPVCLAAQVICPTAIKLTAVASDFMSSRPRTGFLIESDGIPKSARQNHDAGSVPPVGWALWLRSTSLGSFSR
jgi:hypothetical protein